MPWRNGVLVACAPDIFYAEDRDGDGKADHREVLFTGFGEGNQQHRLTASSWAWTAGSMAPTATAAATSAPLKTGTITSISGRDFRFRPDTGEFEAESGQTQYGRHRDDWGHWFGNNNPNWGWHYVLADHDLRRNPHYAPPDPRQTLEPDTRRLSRSAARWPGSTTRAWPTTSPRPTARRRIATTSSAREFATSLFVSEPVHNLVHRMVLEPDGVSFRGHRGPNEADREFLASSDNWFRPTMLKTGPDGALWIADMYRAVIEHPEWIPDDWEKRLDLRAGSEQGRIYRVYPVDKKPRPIPRLDKLDTPGWWPRSTAPAAGSATRPSGCCLHRRDPAAIAPLCERWRSQTKRPKTRVQAIWTLADLGGLDEPAALAGLDDPDPRVRESVIAAVVAAAHGNPGWWPMPLLRLADDADAHVRFQVALALGNWRRPSRGRGAGAAGAARWERPVDAGRDPELGGPARDDAACSACSRRRRPGGAPPPAIVEPLLALVGVACRIGADRADRCSRSASRRGRGGDMPPGSSPRSPGCSKPATTPEPARSTRSRQAVRAGLGGGPPRGRATKRPPRPTGSAAASARRLRAPRRNTSDRDLLLGLLRPQVSVGLQQAAVAALAQTDDPKLADLLLRDWKKHSPQVRSAILDALLSRASWTSSLALVARRRLRAAGRDRPGPAAALLIAARSRFEIARRGRLRPSRPSRGRRSSTSYRSALAIKGDRAAGAAVFKKLCASCHRLGNEGVEVGPDLATLERQVARVPLDRHPRPQPGVRGEVRQLLDRDGRTAAS